MRDKQPKQLSAARREGAQKSERGFTLVETVIALVVMMIVGLAAASLFVYAIQNNLGGGERALAMAVAQQHLEQFRSVAFDDTTLAVGTTTLPTITNGERNYTVVRTVADEINTDGTSKFLKRITITVTPQTGGPAWVRTPVVLVSHRSTVAMGLYVAP
ncbi:MAG: prepilin-type N-terminal cleavage/methylation domain-containing protein [Acidobacteriota bacterium]|nr:prepilin-type N-terminal cleavage/methylation domain-containing protein [Acidobacteriota bacterium]